MFWNSYEAAVYSTQIAKGVCILIGALVTFSRYFFLSSSRALILSCVFFFLVLMVFSFPVSEEVFISRLNRAVCRYSLARRTRADKIDHVQLFAFPKVLLKQLNEG